MAIQRGGPEPSSGHPFGPFQRFYFEYRQAQLVQDVEHSEQRCLIGEGAVEGLAPSRCGADPQTAQPLAPALRNRSLHRDDVLNRFTLRGGSARHHCLARHDADTMTLSVDDGNRPKGLFSALTEK
jgi:hypothetical protein